MTNFNNSYRKYVFSLEQINQAAEVSPVKLIDSVENSFKSELSSVVNYIMAQENCKIIMLSGPSGSGKTTTSHIIQSLLLKQGKKSTMISLDNFFLGKKGVPLDENGKRNYDSIDSINVSEVNRCIKKLIETGQCDMPTYSFKSMEPSTQRLHVKLESDSIVIIEGIHALNPILMPSIDPSYVLKIYVDVKQGINDCNGQILSSTDIRFVRRMIRDYKYRATPIEFTAYMWDSVCENADVYITPFKTMSDITINSIHIYEPCVFSPILAQLMKNINKDDPYYQNIKKMFTALDKFYPIGVDHVPQTSLLREFI